MPLTVPDDPYIRYYERTGYPPWHRYQDEEEDDEPDPEDDGEGEY